MVKFRTLDVMVKSLDRKLSFYMMANNTNSEAKPPEDLWNSIEDAEKQLIEAQSKVEAYTRKWLETNAEDMQKETERLLSVNSSKELATKIAKDLIEQSCINTGVLHETNNMEEYIRDIVIKHLE